MKPLTICAGCGVRRPVHASGICHACTMARGNRQDRLRDGTPVLLTLLPEDARRLGLAERAVVRVEGTTAGGRRIDLYAMVQVVGRMGAIEDDEDDE